MCNGCLESIFALLIMVNLVDDLRNEHLIHVISPTEVAGDLRNEHFIYLIVELNKLVPIATNYIFDILTKT